MSLRTRYQRYRRYGLEPLPADASKEQREARIAELRTLRGKRRRKVALRSGIGTLAIAVGVAALAYWLLMTIGGRDLLLRQIVARLPAGSFFTGAPNVFTASIEYERYFLGPWGAAVFIDSGSAFDGKSPDMRTGVGIGVRWRSPVGPVRIDIARGLNSPDSPFTLHLNIGASL